MATETNIKLLLVDDEEEFRAATTKVLTRRGFSVTEAESGARALEMVAAESPEVVLLDLKMPGMDGIATLQELRKLRPALPVIILTGHGGFDEAMAGIELEVVDFLQKPVNVEKLALHIRRLLSRSGKRALRERTVAELMVPIVSYRRVDVDDAVAVAIEAMQETLFAQINGKVAEQGHRSLLVFRGRKQFVGLVRMADLLRVLVPPYLKDPDYASFFTGMFLAQCKALGALRVGSLLRRDPPTIEPDTPLMEALHMMVSRGLINLPVLREGKLVGILRDKDLMLEIANNCGLM